MGDKLIIRVFDKDGLYRYADFYVAWYAQCGSAGFFVCAHVYI